MTQTDVIPHRLEHEAPAPPHERRKRWGANVARWLEELIPRGVGVVFLWAGATKAWDGSKLHRVFAFDGVPQPLIVPLTHAVWVAEIVIGLLLLIAIARRRAVVAAVLVLFVYSVQIAYLIMADNPPKDCGCISLMAKYASAKQAMTLGLLRNALMAGALEWVRLRMAGRAVVAAAGGTETKEGRIEA